MNKSLVRQAADAYSSGSYAKALELYGELGRLIGRKNFHANIALTEKKLQNSRRLDVCQSEQTAEQVASSLAQSASQLHLGRGQDVNRITRDSVPRVISLPCESREGRIELADNPVWCEFKLSDTDFIIVSVQIGYEHISAEKDRNVLAIVEYLDISGCVIAGSYVGFTKSDNVGWFVYLSPQGKGGTTFTLRPPCGSTRVRIGFRSRYVRLPQRVTMSRNVMLRWHDNNPVQEAGFRTISKSPTLAVLPFEAPAPPVRKRLTVASVLDKFSHACFDPECDLIPITPTRWREELIDRKIDLVLVESAWHGNDDAWQYRVAKYSAPPGNELSEVLRWARKTGVPAVFWNKEDPPNFHRFIDRATEFDYIFTTDENCIERYMNLVPASTCVGALPFAAQTRIHNPRLDESRISATSFAGTYYADDYAPRRNAMNMLLRTAARYGLDIFDRMHGVMGKDKDRFTFPIDLQQYIRGSLAYDDMLKAYRRYRVGLNVNSVSDSPTMFSRRVFELLACGTPVVSTESRGIDCVFDGLVPTVESEEEAVHVLNALMLDPAHWLKASVRGLRAVFKDHTYAHRLQKVVETVGLRARGGAMPAPVVVIFPRGDANRFASAMRSQSLPAAAVIVVGTRYSDKDVQSHVNAIRAAGFNAKALPASNIVTYLRHRHSESVVAICDSRNHYGPAYLLDAAIALQGAPEGSASTILPDADPVHETKAAGFEAAARVGMPCTRLHTGTLVVRHDNALLLDAFAFGQDQDVFDTCAPQLRTRAGFDFTSRSDLSAGRDAATYDLR
jgi:spore maturation protein CgeB